MRRILILVCGAFLSISLVNAVSLEVTKKAGNMPSDQVPGVAKTSTDTTASAPTIEDKRAALIASGDIKQQALHKKSIFNDNKSYGDETHGFEWVGNAEKGHLEINQPDGSKVAVDLQNYSPIVYSWGERYWLRDADNNSYAVNLWKSTGNVTSGSYYSTTPGSDRTLENAPKGFQDLFTAVE